MTFNYESSVWGRGTATLSPGDPTSIRLREALGTLEGLRAGDRVLEVGCGAGQFIRAIKKFRPELACHGSDISRNALDAAKQTNDGVVYVEQTGSSLPFIDGTFDAVVIFDVLEHVDDPAIFMREINRVLRPGGRLYAFVPCEGDILSFWRLLRLLNIGAALTRKFAGHIQYFSRRSLFDLVRKSGSAIKSVKYSEHILGQLLGLFAFFSMNIASRRQGSGQINNEKYFAENLAGHRLRWLRKLVNIIIYTESFLLRRVPSPNVHLVAEKN